MPMDLPQFLIILAVAFVASMLSSMSGAGAAILTTPVWLWLGFPLGWEYGRTPPCCIVMRKNPLYSALV